jgi:hypothetical protein
MPSKMFLKLWEQVKEIKRALPAVSSPSNGQSLPKMKRTFIIFVSEGVEIIKLPYSGHGIRICKEDQAFYLSLEFAQTLFLPIAKAKAKHLTAER